MRSRGCWSRISLFIHSSLHIPSLGCRPLHWYFILRPISTMVADALVYHPTVAHYLRFVATTSKSPSPLPVSHLPQLTPLPSDSRPRQAPPYPPVLLALLCLVPLPYQQPRAGYRPLRGYQEAIRSHAEVPPHREECRTFQGCRGGHGCEGWGSSAEVLCGGEAAGICDVPEL